MGTQKNESKGNFQKGKYLRKVEIENLVKLTPQFEPS